MPAAACAPGSVRKRQPMSSWARHPEASPCLAVSHLVQAWPASGLQGRQSGCGEAVEEGLSDTGFCRLRPDLLTGGLSGSTEPGRGWWDRDLMGWGHPQGVPANCLSLYTRGRGYRRTHTRTERRGRWGRTFSFLPQLGLSTPGQSQGAGQRRRVWIAGK